MDRQFLLKLIENTNYSLQRDGDDFRYTLCNYRDEECNHIIMQEPVNEKWKLKTQFCSEHLPGPQQMTCQSNNHSKTDSKEYLGMPYSNQCNRCYSKKQPVPENSHAQDNE
jgi:hypothetical protein